MKAAVIHEFGDTHVLKYEEVSTPKPKPGHLVIKVLAAGINRLDHYIREGSIVPELAFPHVLGHDAVGEVFEVGRDVEGVEVGERVIVVPGFPLKETEAETRPAATAPSFTLPGMGIWGSYAQYMEVPAHAVIKDDTGLSPDEVATLPMVLATSVHAVKGVAGIKAGDKVLIHAGASGSGSMHIQVAKVLGAEVATTVRDNAKVAFAEEAGADIVFNTHDDDFVAGVKEWTDGRGADAVIDNLGGDVLAKSIEAVKYQGIVVAYGFAAGVQVSFDIRSLFFAQKQLKGSMASDVEDLEWGLEQVKAGTIKPLLDRSLPLKDAARAHKFIINSEVKGNLVLLPWAA